MAATLSGPRAAFHAALDRDRRAPGRPVERRNLGDEYFGASEDVNFVDLDFALIGPIVRDASASFDRYWNASTTWPMRALDPGAVNEEALAEFEDGEDIGVVERPRGLGFQLEARKAVAVCSQIFGEELGRHFAPELRVGGAVDLSHPPGPRGSQDLVGAEARAEAPDRRVGRGVSLHGMASAGGDPVGH